MTTLLIIFAFIFVFGPIAQAYAKRMSRDLPPDARKTLADVERLRHEVEQLSAQMGRLQEEQSFMLRLLSEGERRMLERKTITNPAADGEPERGRPTAES